jgi:hypothetical protein
VIDAANGYAYFGTYTTPGIVAKIDLGTTYTLTVNTAGTGAGSVTSKPDANTFRPGTVVTLTATASSTSTFAGWSGDVVSMTNPLVITMDSTKIITASFNIHWWVYMPVVMKNATTMANSDVLADIELGGQDRTAIEP